MIRKTNYAFENELFLKSVNSILNFNKINIVYYIKETNNGEAVVKVQKI